MTIKSGYCKNYDLCGVASRREAVREDGGRFVCPECGSALKEIATSPSGRWRWGAWVGLAAAGLVAAGGAIVLPGLFPPTPADAPGLPTLPVETPVPPIGPTGDTAAPTGLTPVGCSPKPLLMPGKRSLYQRVLTRPDAILVAKPGDTAGKPLAPLLAFYVYQRQALGSDSWVQIGADAQCRAQGWVREERTVPWRHQIVVTFDNPAGRTRAVLFKDPQVIRQIAEQPQPGEELSRILGTLTGANPDPRVVASEPENYIDFTRNFYLLPILDFSEATVAGNPLRLLHVHSIAEEPGHSDGAPLAVKAAVVFVIDSTISMGKYIERTKQAVLQIFRQISKSPGGNEIRFGLVAFRSNVSQVPELEYVAKVFVDPNVADNAAEFAAGIARVREAPVSSARFDEDAFAGVMRALEKIDWSPYLGRHLVLISDAGALDADDTLSATRKSAGEVAAAARDRGVLLYAIHLQTPEGQRIGNHQKAAMQYGLLTKAPLTGGSLYYPVQQAENVANFGAVIDCAARSMTHSIRTIGGPPAKSPQPRAEYCPPGKPAVNKMREDAELIGYALRMKYLGSTAAGQPAPRDFGGWIADHDLARPTRPAIEKRVLLTKNQLSNLSKGVKVILEAAKSGRTSPAQFHRILVDFAARMGRDPALAKPAENLTIAESGILGEYLDDLPYKSVILNIDQATWETMSDSEQDGQIRAIENKLERYAIYEADCTRWVDLANPQRNGCDTAAADNGELVFPVPLDALP